MFFVIKIACVRYECIRYDDLPFDLNVFLDFFVYFGQKKYLKSYAQASGTIVYPQGPSSNLCGKTRLLCVFLWSSRSSRATDELLEDGGGGKWAKQQ